jgi:hypothetical protein
MIALLSHSGSQADFDTSALRKDHQLKLLIKNLGNDGCQADA